MGGGGGEGAGCDYGVPLQPSRPPTPAGACLLHPGDNIRANGTARKVLGNPGSNLKSIAHRCYLFEVAFVWELTKETIVLPLGCLQGGGRAGGGPAVLCARRQESDFTNTKATLQTRKRLYKLEFDTAPAPPKRCSSVLRVELDSSLNAF